MRSRYRILVAFLSASTLLALTAMPAQAAWTNTLRIGQIVMSACSWHWKAGSNGDDPNPVNIIAGGSPWAANGYASDNGALQSFSSLTIGGVNSWNTVVRNAPNYLLGLGYQTVAGNSDIRFYSGTPSGTSSNIAGITYMQIGSRGSLDSSGVACPPVNPNGSWTPKEIYKVNIYNKVMDTWFTQTGNDRWGRDVRKEWEKCFPDPDTGAAPTNDPRLTNYTCTKKLDYGSVVTHELGHALGMVHADINGYNSPAGLAGECGPNKVKLQATMCQTVPEGRTAQRTLEVSDVDAYGWRSTYP